MAAAGRPRRRRWDLGRFLHRLAVLAVPLVAAFVVPAAVPYPFTPSSQFASGGSNPHGVVALDLNGDGRRDLVAANAGSSSVGVLLADTSGGFSAAVTFATGAAPKAVVGGRLDGDATIDLVTSNQDSNSVSVLKGRGDGTFSARTDYPACTGAHETALADLDADGDLDLAVACWGGSVISVLRNTGSGSFSAPATYGSGANPHSVVAADFNGDGRTDVAVANRGGNTVGVLTGRGDGTLNAVTTFSVGAGPHSIRAGDLNGDGRVDLVTANDLADTVSVLLGRGDGTFDGARHSATGRVPKGVAVTDVDTDGRPDVITANTAGDYPSGVLNPGGNEISVLLGDGTGGLAAPVNYTVGHTPFAVHPADLDGDGRDELITANYFGHDLSVLRHLGNGFREVTVFSGLTNPTSVRFASDGRVFVAEKSGLVKVFDSLSDPTPTVFADLNVNVHNYWDRGLLGLELHPDFPATPYVYVLYTHDAAIGGTAPRWGTAGVLSDPCPTPPGPNADGCVVSGRLSELTASGNTMAGSERVLLEGWCQQYPSHSVGALHFGADGALYVSGGEGASFTFVDYGQAGSPKNPCGDPPSGVGGTQTPPTAEGGSLRAQDVRTTSDPTGLSGSILRIDPATGNGAVGNPLALSGDANERRILAHGFRNPFRFALRPGTSEVWVGDVGHVGADEIDVVPDRTLRNYGWPCYEGPIRNAAFDVADLQLCESLYAAGTATMPTLAYKTGEAVVAGESCPNGSTTIAGLAFYPGGSYPDKYDGALFFADYSRNCVWALLDGDPTRREVILGGLSNPVDLQPGPGGDLFYPDQNGGTIRRIVFGSSSPPPPPPPPPAGGYLSEMTWTSSTNGWGPAERDKSNGEAAAGDGRTLTLNGTTFAKGLGVHALSEIVVPVPTGCTRFRSSVGVDDETGANGSVAFQVFLGATKLFDSGTLTATSTTRTVDVAVSSGAQLRLVVTDGGDGVSYDHADWAEARFDCSAGGDTTPPTVSSRTPPAGATGIAASVSPTATFSEAIDPASVTTSTFFLVRDGSPTPIAATVTYDASALRATLDPTSDLQPGVGYTATVKSGSGGVKDAAGNALAADVTWSFTTATAVGGATRYLSDLTWVSSTNGWGPVERDRSNGESGSNDGGTLTLNGTTYAKGLGTHAVSEVVVAVPSDCTRFAAAVGVDDEVGAKGSVVFQVFVATTKLFDSGVMTGSSATQQVDVAVTPGSQVRLAVGSAISGISHDHADWASARFACSAGSGGDTTPPTITASTPSSGATGVSVSVSPTATFSEPMDAATVDSTTFSLLQQGSTTPVAAAVSYNAGALTATLDPAQDLAAGATYTATVRGGSSGVEDAAGNALASDVSWSFTTANPASNTQPTATIATPAAGTTWAVGDTISFSGSGSDAEDGSLAPASLSWALVLNHCPSSCHTHTVQQFAGVASGSFVAPDHDYPSYLELRLTATDSAGATDTATHRLDPRTSTISFATSPTGLQLTVAGATRTAPFDTVAIVGSTLSVSAATPQTLGSDSYDWASWSDGGARTHTVTAGASNATLTATFTQTGATIRQLSDLTPTASSNGWGPVERDRSNGENAAGDGATLTLNGVTFAKGLGAHALSEIRYAVPVGCTRLLASVGLDDEVGANGSVVFRVLLGTTSLFDSGTMTGVTATRTVDVAVTEGSEVRLVLTDAGNGNAYDHGDWADARFVCGVPAADTTPPSVSTTAPSAGATGVPASVAPAVTFSEPMTAASITSTTFRLVQQGSASPVAAGISYDSATRTATLDPGADLQPETTYTATVVGGSGGVTDVAGNPLPADFVWTFTTAAAAGGATTRYLSDLTWSGMTNAWGPVEKDLANGEQGTGDGGALTLNGTTFAKGLGAHAASEVSYVVPASCTRLKAEVGVDDEVGARGSVVFQVFVGTTKLFDSGPMTGATPTASVDVAVTAGSEVRLVLTDGGDGIAYDHGDWADARFSC